MKHTNESPAAPAAQNSAETAANITGSAAVCQQQAELLVSQGRATEAEPVYRRGLEQWPGSLDLHLHYARFKAQQGRYVEALQDLNELMKTWAHRAEVWILGGEICLRDPQFNQVALDWTAEAVRLHPGDAQITTQRERALASAAKAAEAGAQAVTPVESGVVKAPREPSAANHTAKALGKISFVLGATRHGPMIFSRLDACYIQQNQQTLGYGVGFQLMETGGYDTVEVDLLKRLLVMRREFFQDGVVGVDCGANIGVHTVEWGRLMQGWGSVISFEAQEKIYYALAGNVILNNLLNVKAIYAAVSDKEGFLEIPQPDYMVNSSFGSLELRKNAANENIGQAIDYDYRLITVRTVTIDSLNLPRVDLIKMDVEGMEELALQGARETIARCKPIACVEIIKSNPQAITNFFSSLGYRLFPGKLNCLAIHQSDPTLTRVVKAD